MIAITRRGSEYMIHIRIPASIFINTVEKCRSSKTSD